MANGSGSSQSPWITFQHSAPLELGSLHIGEAFSKCEHIGQSLVPPGVVRRLTQVYLARGALASTAIEGNTLSEQQALDVLAGDYEVPRSQQYQQQELINVANAIKKIDESARAGAVFCLTPEWIQGQNRQVLEGLELAEHVEPGQYTTRQLVVGPYRAAKPSEVPGLIESLCAWIESAWLAPSRDRSLAPSVRFAYRFHAAVLTHLYLAWIHPFGDGNGRTARLAECAILAHSDLIPWISGNLLSDHYNRTRSRYYARLQAASQEGDVSGFIRYSAEGFADQLREQIKEIRRWVQFATWTHYVHSTMHDEPSGESKDRRRDLALELAGLKGPGIHKSQVPLLSPELAAAYATKHQKTVSRDLTRLLELNLIEKIVDGREHTYRSAIGTLEAFRPFGNDHPSGLASYELNTDLDSDLLRAT